MTRIARPARIAYAVAAVAIVVDQLTKWWMVSGLDLAARGRIEVGPVFDLSYTLNRGVSFGLLAGGETARWLLSIFSVGVAVALAWWVSRPQPERPDQAPGRPAWLFPVAIGLIMGGALGNVIDRVRIGAVIDFLDFSDVMFRWVFNVADSCITVGVVLLLLDSWLAERRAPVGAAAQKE